MFELPDKFPNDLKLSTLGNKEISRKPLKWLYIKASAPPATRTENFDSCARKVQISPLKHFTEQHALPNLENLSTKHCSILSKA